MANMELVLQSRWWSGLQKGGTGRAAKCGILFRRYLEIPYTELEMPNGISKVQYREYRVSHIPNVKGLMGIIALALAHDWPEGSQLHNFATFHIGLGFIVLGIPQNSV